jgi:hypothetical protein
MSELSLVDLLNEVRQEALSVIIRHKKKASFRLYEVLARAMSIVERCDRNTGDRHELHSLIAQMPLGSRNRQYVEKGSDDNTLVGRYVFQHSNYTNICRYAHAMREAAKAQISSDQLANYLRTNGGINTLYMKKPNDHFVMSKKNLYLTKSVTFNRNEPFTITLKWCDDNRFDVLDMPKQPD